MEFQVKSSVLDRRRKLDINIESIEFDDSDLVNSVPTKFERESIEAFRFGIHWIRGYKFIFGRKYCLDIKSENHIIKIRLISLYGIKKKALSDKLQLIINTFYDTHYNDIFNRYILKYREENKVIILDTTFSENGVQFGNNTFIKWEDLGTKSYATYYALFSKDEPTIYKSYTYFSDWNATLVYSLSKFILAEKGLSS